MSIGPFQILIVALVILVLFGRGRISEMMGDFGKGVRSFRKGLNEDADAPLPPAGQIDSKPAAEAAEAKTPDSSGNPG